MNSDPITSVALRRIPYPYKAMLAICSDLDETPDQHTYLELVRYFNTTEQTVLGRGVGLETGNTIYFDMPPSQLAYWNANDEGKRKIQQLIQSGHIDCLHSFGDLATTRAHAHRALEELSRQNCSIEVWIDHGQAITNFGEDIMCGQGDVVGSEAYHADISTEYGIKYVWRGRVTSIIGQDAPRRLKGIWVPHHPIASGKTFMREFVKGMVAGVGNTKYAMHSPNRIMREVQLRSGQTVSEFMRASFHWGGVSCGDTAAGLPDVFRNDALRHLVRSGGTSIIYTHLGKFAGGRFTFSPLIVKALKLLADFSQAGEILVTTTHRLLRYCHVSKNLKISSIVNDDSVEVDLVGSCSENALQGLSIYVPDAKKVKVIYNGNELKNIQYNAHDHTGRTSVCIPWKCLEFPQL